MINWLSMRNIAFISLLILIGAGCTASSTIVKETKQIDQAGSEQVDMEVEVSDSMVVLPIDQYLNRRSQKVFGEYIQDRFTGYHVGDDIEYGDQLEEVAVLSIAEGIVLYRQRTSGYGGLIIVEHTIDNRKVRALYGHLDLESTPIEIGSEVVKGQLLANLGDHQSIETDGERKHLHFGLYEGSDLRLQGYESSALKVDDWINPQDFFSSYGLNMITRSRQFDSVVDLGGNIFQLSFTVPAGMEVEYIPAIESLNIFSMSGEGTARQRSQIFLRYFDANRFLTLGTVTIHSQDDLTVGTANYTARRYDIAKKTGVADFSQQPDWRNDRHIVTDFVKGEGFGRYYVVAANPELDQAVYEAFLVGVTID